MVKRFIKLLFLLAVLGGAAFLFSYTGARLQAGKILGSNLTGLGARSMRFEYEGVDGVIGRPRAWIVAYSPATALGLQEIRIIVSPTGKLLATAPRDLATRIEALRRREP